MNSERIILSKWDYNLLILRNTVLIVVMLKNIFIEV